jgi:type 1 glutamine amidotransferase
MRQALIVRGGWDGHQPVEATDLFVPFLKDHDFAVRTTDSPAVYADADAMGGVDLIVQCMTMSSITAEQLAGLISAVSSGAGLAGWHGGICDSYRASSDYLQLIGGQFATHASRYAPGDRTGEQADNYVPHRIELTSLGRDHEITRGIADFDLETEQYWVLTDDYNEVLATTTTATRQWGAWHRPVTCPAVWTRQWGDGRVFVATPGHRVEVLEDPNVRAIVERGLLWAAR